MKKKLDELVWGLSQNKNIMGARYSGACLPSQHLRDWGKKMVISSPGNAAKWSSTSKEPCKINKHSRTYIQMHMHTHPHTHSPMLINHTIHSCTYVCAYTYIYIHAHKLIHINSHSKQSNTDTIFTYSCILHVHICSHTHILTHNHTHALTHTTHTHTLIYSQYTLIHT